ncbi:hypothetical protein GN956_G4622 [Arapaima gigas]
MGIGKGDPGSCQPSHHPSAILQACYGIVEVPEGCWQCRTCILGINPQCLPCPKKGGAMKATRTKTRWALINCALWIPEVSIACLKRMEPISKLSHIPPSCWALVCSLCKLKTGACIQCSVKSCIIPFHVICTFEHSLKMKTILDEGDKVKFKSYYLKHTKCMMDEAPLNPAGHKTPTETGKLSLQSQKLQELEEEFFTMLKCNCNFNKALLPPKEEYSILQQPEENSIHIQIGMVMLLRQDLKQVRNLVTSSMHTHSKPQRKCSIKEQVRPKVASENQRIAAKSYQDSDG